MKVDLDKVDLVTIVIGSVVTEDLTTELFEMGCGVYNVNTGWVWNESALIAMTELELWNVYLKCKG